MARSSPAVGERRDRFVSDILNEERGRVTADPILWAGGVPLGGAPATQAATTLQMRFLPLFVPRRFDLRGYAVAVTAVAPSVRLRAALYRYEYNRETVRLVLAGYRSRFVAVVATGVLGLAVATATRAAVPAGVYYVGVVAEIGGGGALTLRATNPAPSGWVRTISSFIDLPGHIGWPELVAGVGFAVAASEPAGRVMLEGL